MVSFAPLGFSPEVSRTGGSEEPLLELLGQKSHTDNSVLEEADNISQSSSVKGVLLSDCSGQGGRKTHSDSAHCFSDCVSAFSRRSGSEYTGNPPPSTATGRDGDTASSGVKSSQSHVAKSNAMFNAAENTELSSSVFSNHFATSMHTSSGTRDSQLSTNHDVLMVLTSEKRQKSVSPKKFHATAALEGEAQEDPPSAVVMIKQGENCAGNLERRRPEETETEAERAVRKSAGGESYRRQQNGLEGRHHEMPCRRGQGTCEFVPVELMQANHCYHHCNPLNSHSHLSASAGSLCDASVRQQPLSSRALRPTAVLSSECVSGAKNTGANHRINGFSSCTASGAPHLCFTATGNRHWGALGSAQQRPLALNAASPDSLHNLGERYMDRNSLPGSFEKGARKLTAFSGAPFLSPLYEHCGVHEDLVDADSADLPLESSFYGNIVSFLHAVSPRVAVERRVPLLSSSHLGDVPPVGQENAGINGSSLTHLEPSIALLKVWEALDLPFACTIPFAEPISLSSVRSPQEHVVYTPFLSGFRLRFHPTSSSYAKLRAMRQNTGDAFSVVSRQNIMDQGEASSRDRDDEFVNHTGDGDDRRKETTAFLSSAAPTAFTPCETAQEKVEDLSHSMELGFVTWSATERPDQRSLVLEQVYELAESNERYSVLLSATTTELDHQSWFAVLWQPVYDQGHTAKNSCGSFIVYYALRPPRHMVSCQASGAVRAMNSDVMSPVFRCDRHGTRWDMWAPTMPMSFLSSCSPVHSPSCEAANSPSAGPVDAPVNQKTAVLREKNGGMCAAMESPEASAADRDARVMNAECLREKSALNGTPHGAFCKHFSETKAGCCQMARIPVVGIIPNRCRGDVWFLPCSSANLQNSHGDQTKKSGTLSPRPCYRAPLFLFAAALQLMSCNAVESVWRHALKNKSFYATADALLAANSAAAGVSENGPSGDGGTVGVIEPREAQSILAMASRKTFGVDLIFHGAKGYRRYRESVNADAGTTAPHDGSTVTSRSASSAAAAAASDLGAVIEGLPDFYQWVQFDGLLLNFAQRYA